MRREETVVDLLPASPPARPAREAAPRGNFMPQPAAPPPRPAPRPAPHPAPPPPAPRAMPLPAPAPAAFGPRVSTVAEPLAPGGGARSLTQTLAALEDTGNHAATPAPVVTPRGQVIVVFACRGGAGATTVAVNTGATLARSGKTVCLLDLDLQLGDVFTALDLEPSTSIAAVAREAGTIDGPALRRRLVRHDSGLYALSQVGRPGDVDAALVERMPALVATLVDHFDYVIVDGVRDFGDHALAALDMADRIALVLTQDVAAVRRAARATALFRQLGYSDRKVQLVVNRHVGKAAIPDEEIERALGLRIGARIRNDYARMASAMNQGALLADVARHAPVAVDLDGLARGWAHDGRADLAARPGASAGRADTDRVAKSAPGGPGLLSRLFRKGAR